MTKVQRRRLRAARDRLASEPLVPLDEIAVLLGHPPRTVRRWAESGNGGLYLDAVEKAGVWYSSREAALRLVRLFRERDEEERDRAEGMARRGGTAADLSVVRPTG